MDSFSPDLFHGLLEFPSSKAAIEGRIITGFIAGVIYVSGDISPARKRMISLVPAKSEGCALLICDGVPANLGLCAR